RVLLGVLVVVLLLLGSGAVLFVFPVRAIVGDPELARKVGRSRRDRLRRSIRRSAAATVPRGATVITVIVARLGDRLVAVLAGRRIGGGMRRGNGEHCQEEQCEYPLRNLQALTPNSLFSTESADGAPGRSPVQLSDATSKQHLLAGAVAVLFAVS